MGKAVLYSWIGPKTGIDLASSKAIPVDLPNENVYVIHKLEACQARTSQFGLAVEDRAHQSLDYVGDSENVSVIH